MFAKVRLKVTAGAEDTKISANSNINKGSTTMNTNAPIIIFLFCLKPVFLNVAKNVIKIMIPVAMLIMFAARMIRRMTGSILMLFYENIYIFSLCPLVVRLT